MRTLEERITNNRKTYYTVEENGKIILVTRSKAIAERSVEKSQESDKSI